MSHFAEIKVSALAKNEKELIASLEEFFGENTVKVFKEAMPLEGYDKAARKSAHLIVEKDVVGKTNDRKYAYNDFGFERCKDGTYTLHCDPTDVSDVSRNKIMQDYAERVANRQLKAQGYMVKRQAMKDGTVKLVATKYS